MPRNRQINGSNKYCLTPDHNRHSDDGITTAIHFKYSGSGDYMKCKQPCCCEERPDETTMIGSLECQQCYNFLSVNPTEATVECRDRDAALGI